MKDQPMIWVYVIQGDVLCSDDPFLTTAVPRVGDEVQIQLVPDEEITGTVKRVVWNYSYDNAMLSPSGTRVLVEPSVTIFIE